MDRPSIFRGRNSRGGAVPGCSVHLEIRPMMIGRMLDHCPVHGTCERSECTGRCADQEAQSPSVPEKAERASAPTELLVLADRCEHESGCWKLDVAISDALGLCHDGGTPCYTRRIDDALTLVPASLDWCIRGVGRASVWSRDMSIEENTSGDNLAIALVAAALRARAVMAQLAESSFQKPERTFRQPEQTVPTDGAAPGSTKVRRI